MATASGPEGVLLDTNVWRYLSDADCYTRLLVASHRAGIPIVVAPGALYETLAIGDPQIRHRVVKLMVHSRWHRLMPEAFLECEEILGEVHRVRPEWLLPNPDLQWRDRNIRDWARAKGGLWQRARDNTDRLAEWVKQPDLEAARAQAGKRREDMGSLKRGEWKQHPWIEPPSETPGWRGDRIPLWRFEGRQIAQRHLSQDRNPYRDWLLPFLGTTRITAASWNEFWFYDVSESAMPRHWLRSTMEWQQGFRKISPGTPGDSQLAAYLVDAAFVASADKVFLDLVDECAQQANFPIASPIRLAGGDAGVEQLLDWLSTVKNSVSTVNTLPVSNFH